MQADAYRSYVTDALKAIAENTAVTAVAITHGEAEGVVMQCRFVDVLEGRPKEEKTGEEIAADVIQKAGLKVVS